MTDIVDPALTADTLGVLPVSGNGGKPISLSEDDTIGREATSKTIRLEGEANKAPYDIPFVPDSLELFADSTAKTFQSGGNFAYEMFKRYERDNLSPPPDPTFKPESFIQRHRKEIPGPLEMQFHMAGSEIEANLMLTDMMDSIRKQEILSRRGGFSTFVAAGLAGIVDVDTPLVMLSGGAAAGFKGGMMSTKWGRMAGSAAAGGVTQSAAATLGFEAGTTNDWTSIPAAGLGGMAFGMLGGALHKHAPEVKANEAVMKAAREFDEYVADGAPLATDLRNETHGHTDPYGSVRADKANDAALEAHLAATKEGKTTKPRMTTGDEEAVIGDLAPRKEFAPGLESIPNTVREHSLGSELQGESGGSIGARQMNPQGSTANIESPRVQDMVNDAKDWARTTGIPDEYNAKYTGIRNRGAAGDVFARAASRFHDYLAASPMATDFDRMWRSGSVVAQRVAYDLFESASGIVRNNRSAAALKSLYMNQLAAVADHLATARKLWDRENGISKYDSFTDTAARHRFNREVLTEMQSRAYDPPGTPRTASAAVQHAADKLDEWGARDIEIGKGRTGEGSIKGYEKLQHYSGYFPQQWSGASMEKLIREGGKSAKDIIGAISEAYVKMHGMTKSDADIYAAAVVNRARRTEQGLDVNLIGILQQDGKEFLADTLRANGVSERAANRLIDKLTGEAAERGQAGHTKGRIDVDMRFTSSTGINMMDLMNNDIAGILDRRVRGTAGAAALARKGIASNADIKAIKEAILAEQQARGKSVRSGDAFSDFVDKDRHMTPEIIDAMFSNFSGGPISGGVNPFVASAIKLTSLALLPQLGLTQMSELGAQMASVSLKRWFSHAGGALRGDAINPTSALAQEIKHMGIMVPEDRFFRNDLNLDMDRQGPASSWFMQKMQTTLHAGQRIEGYTSLYYQVRNFQQRVAATSAADKIMQNMKGLRNDLTGLRAQDIGLDDKLFARVKAYVDNGTVEFKDGSLHKMNLSKWAPEDAENFSLALNRHVNQVVQKAMAGESSVLFHRDGIAALFFHLKSFSLLAVEKQMLRNVRLNDGQTAGTFFAGLATAAAAYSVKQAINGTDKNLTIDKVARGAIGYSNMTGWLPMWVDPVAGLLGLDSLKINNYGSRGQAGDILSLPPALTTLNTMAHIPAIPGHAATGNLTNSDVRALQTTPIIGRAYGMTYLLNQLKN